MLLLKPWWDFCTEFIVRIRNWRHQFQLEMENRRRQLKEPYGGKDLSARKVLPTGFDKSHLPTARVSLFRRKKGNIKLPVCLLSAVWPQTPTTQATLYQRPDCWRRFLVLLVIDVIKPPGTYFNNWLQLSCWSSKLSSPFPATCVLLYAPLDPIREPAKCFKFFSDKHCMQVATYSKFPSANDVIDLCWILYNKTRIVATFFFQRTTAFELFL